MTVTQFADLMTVLNHIQIDLFMMMIVASVIAGILMVRRK